MPLYNFRYVDACLKNRMFNPQPGSGCRIDLFGVAPHCAAGEPRLLAIEFARQKIHSFCTQSNPAADFDAQQISHTQWEAAEVLSNKTCFMADLFRIMLSPMIIAQQCGTQQAMSAKTSSYCVLDNNARK